MKKVCLLLIAMLTVNFTFSQENGNLKNRFYFRFGTSMPTWNYYDLNGKSDWYPDTKRFGGIFELGSIFMLNKIFPQLRVIIMMYICFLVRKSDHLFHIVLSNGLNLILKQR